MSTSEFTPDSHIISPIIVETDEDEIIHSPDHPFCSTDPDCPCHTDPDLLAELAQDVENGLLTPELAAIIASGVY